MINSEDILNGLQSIVNDYSLFAILWHVVLYILIAALIAQWKPSNKLFALILSILILSVALFAWISGNPFNGTVFSLAAIFLFLFGLRSNNQLIGYSRQPYVLAGMIMIAFGLIYPHFIEPGSIIQYLYLSPAGIIPCPTLSIVIGFLLIYRVFDSRLIALTLILLGLFYGLFGVFKLGVTLDLFLLFGTGTLLLMYIQSHKTASQ